MYLIYNVVSHDLYILHILWFFFTTREGKNFYTQEVVCKFFSWFTLVPKNIKKYVKSKECTILFF